MTKGAHTTMPHEPDYEPRGYVYPDDAGRLIRFPRKRLTLQDPDPTIARTTHEDLGAWVSDAASYMYRSPARRTRFQQLLRPHPEIAMILATILAGVIGFIAGIIAA